MKILSKLKPQNKYVQYCRECDSKLLIDFNDLEDKDKDDKDYFFGEFHCPFCGSLQFLTLNNRALARHYKRFGRQNGVKDDKI